MGTEIPAQNPIAIPRPHQRLLALAMATSQAEKTLNPATQLTYLWLDQLCGAGDSCLYPGTKAMMELTGVCRRTIDRARAELESTGLITVENRPDGKQVVTISEPPENPPELMEIYHGVMSKLGVKLVQKPSQPTVEPVRKLPRRERLARAEHEGSKVEKKIKADGFSLEEKQLLAQLPMMERYLLWGREGLTELDDTKLKPANMNWRSVTADSTDKELKVKSWKAPHFVGYYWWLVSKYNSEHNLPIALPGKGWGRLFRDMAMLQSSMTNNQLLSRIYKLYLFINLIKAELQWMSIPITFDETTLSDNNVTKKMKEIESVGDVELTGRWEKAGFGCVVRNGVPVNPQGVSNGQGQIPQAN